jgi:farnesyl diphosphate synthase/geranylgeranyl diphosphate synthase type II|tara:strand:+ start:28 stop:885 length:858 start_codon:yes stop_codon:yes gene_type:complete
MTFEIYRNRVDDYLNTLLTRQNALNESMRYSVLAGGKRFRPILTYTTASLFDVEPRQVDACAAAIELIHIYSLIHDDLPAMDDDDMRHNQSSSHKIFGEGQAILVGDGLQALAFEVLSGAENIMPGTRIKLLNLLASSAFDMADGQSIDLSVVSMNIDVDFLNSLHLKKTGALLDCAVKFGALLVEPQIDNKDIDILSLFSEKIGLAYQIQDDVLDVLGSDESLGKRQNSDLKKGKPTYPSVIGIEKSSKAYKDLYEEGIEELGELSRNAGALINLTNKIMHRNY